MSYNLGFFVYWKYIQIFFTLQPEAPYHRIEGKCSVLYKINYLGWKVANKREFKHLNHKSFDKVSVLESMVILAQEHKYENSDSILRFDLWNK